MSIARETELWLPVKTFLEQQGYTVRSEVNGCDIVAVRDDTVIAAELKRSFNLSLVLQGVDRQKVADHVYLVTERPKRRGKRWAQVRALCRRLDLGLIVVTFFVRKQPLVEVECEPVARRVGRSHVGRARLEKEFANRSGDYNVGGSMGRPVVTAYREQALRIAHELHQHGQLTVKALREATGNPKAGPILQHDYYGWFERVQRGVYMLTAEGNQALSVFAEVVVGWDDPKGNDEDSNVGSL